MELEHRIADLLGHPVTIGISCGCTRVVTAPIEWMLARLGPDATMDDGERRMICKDCRQRPKLRVCLDWPVSGGRDTRKPEDRKPLPTWVVAD